MKKASVPTVPGFEGLESYGDFKKPQRRSAILVLAKAAAGGGGKGMRVVNERAS
ncbi:MAG: hypothetical protein IPG44_12995 [Anaerolineales bacterium]|nr:hypothetical protein [Anaerolineales bacterium]